MRVGRSEDKGMQSFVRKADSLKIERQKDG
jgi:hypothetical protein